MNIAIILASGMGKRMNAGKNKVFLKLKEKPMIYYSIFPFQKSKLIDEILIVSKKEEIKDFKKLVQKFKLDKVKSVIEGGQERQDSAFNAVSFLNEKYKKKNNILLFHNGANPFVTTKEIEDSINAAKKYGACVIAHPAKDTIKQVDERIFVEKTLERKKLWNMQTPQTVKLSLAYEAFRRAKDDNFIGTDDVSLVERLGKKVKIIEGSIFNFKITTPLDFELAKIIIRKYKFK